MGIVLSCEKYPALSSRYRIFDKGSTVIAVNGRKNINVNINKFKHLPKACCTAGISMCDTLYNE